MPTVPPFSPPPPPGIVEGFAAVTAAVGYAISLDASAYSLILIAAIITAFMAAARATLPRKRDVLAFILGRACLALVLTVPLATYMHERHGFDWRITLMPIAIFIAAFGPKYIGQLAKSLVTSLLKIVGIEVKS